MVMRDCGRIGRLHSAGDGRSLRGAHLTVCDRFAIVLSRAVESIAGCRAARGL
jgi:hypothetical protein